MTIPKKLVMAVLDRDAHRCVLKSFGCTGVATVADHRVERGMGGNTALDVPWNLVSACGICNGLKDSDVQFARECRRRGILIPRTQSTARDLGRAATIPVQWPDGSWWLLTGAERLPMRADEANELIALHGLERAS